MVPLLPPNRLPDELKNSRCALKPIEIKIIRQGLINIHEIEPTIVVDLKYASEDNFLAKDMYEGMENAYLQKEVVIMLSKSQQYLRKQYPDYSLVVFDAVRPRHIQQKMWDALELPYEEKIGFLSHPEYGSVHNFGAAVDVSIIDNMKNLLHMGTVFDHMGELAHPAREVEMLEQGKLKPVHVKNRKILRETMQQGGFRGIQTEWWHFNAMTRQQAREKYTIIE